MKKSELRQLIKEEIQALNEVNIPKYVTKFETELKNQKPNGLGVVAFGNVVQKLIKSKDLSTKPDNISGHDRWDMSEFQPLFKYLSKKYGVKPQPTLDA
jgi:hypothetical protein